MQIVSQVEMQVGLCVIGAGRRKLPGLPTEVGGKPSADGEVDKKETKSIDHFI